MGLLDAFFGSSNQQASKQAGGLLSGLDPATVGLLSAAAAGLEAGGPSRVPISTGQALGRMIQGGLLGYHGALEAQSEREDRQMLHDYRKAQIGELSRKAKASEDLDSFFKNRLFGASGIMPAADLDASVTALGQGAQFGDIGPTIGNAARMNAIRPPQLQGQNSAFPFGINDIAYLKTKGVDLADVYKLATDPIKLEGGSTYRDRATGVERYMPKIGEGMQLGPNGVSLAPGYLDSMGAVKGAETRAVEGAKAAYDLLPLGYVGQDGRPIGGTRGSYISSFSQPTAPQAPSSPANFPRVSPQQQAAADQEALLYAKQDIDNAPTPAARAQAQRVYDTMVSRSNNGQSVMTGGGFAHGAQRQGPPVLQSEAEKQLQLGTITGRQNTQQDLNKNWITASYNPVLEAGRAATLMTSSLDALKNIDLKTGWGVEAKANAAAFLTSLGVAPKNAELLATNAQKFQSVAMDRLLVNLQAQKGPQTEGDSTRAQQVFAQLKNTPAANEFIAAFARAKANADARRAQFYQEALPLAQQTGDLNEIDRRWAKIQGSVWSDPVLKPYLKGVQ